MIERKENIIKNKIINGDYFLTDEDKYILQNNINLIKDLISIIPRNENTNNILSLLFDTLGKNINYNWDNIKNILDQDGYIKYLLWQIDISSVISMDIIKMFCDLSELSQEQIKLLENECLEVKKNGNNFTVNSSYLLKLLDEKDYETISKISDVAGCEFNEDDELTIRLKNEFPFDKYNLLCIADYLDSFSDKLDSMNIIYSLINFDPTNEVEINNIITRLKRGDKVFLNSNLINKLKFSKIISCDYEKSDEIIKLLFKENPFLYLYLSYYSQICQLDNYSSYIYEQILNNIDENSNIKISNYNVRENEELLKKLMDAKQYKCVANNCNCLQYFDILYNYIDSNYENIDISSFKDIYNNMKNKDIFKQYINQKKYSINFSDTNILSEDINFLIKEGFIDLIYNILRCDQYDLAVFLQEHPDYFKNNIATNVYYVFNMFRYDLDNILSLPDDLIRYVFDCTIGTDDNYFNIFIDLFNNPEFINNTKLTEKKLKKLFNSLVPYFNKFNFSIDNLLILSNKFGPIIIKYLKNPNIVKLLNMDTNKLTSFVNLFPDSNYEMRDLENAFDSIVQARFTIENSNDAEIFHNILVYLDMKDNKYLELVDKLVLELDEVAIKYLNNININIENPKKYILNLLNTISSNSVDRNKALDELHQICTYYLDKKRGKYKNSFDIGDELGLPFEYESNQLNTALVKLCLKDPMNHYLYDLLYTQLDDNKYCDSSILPSLIKETIAFYVGDISKDEIKNDMKLIQSIIPVIIKKTTEYLKDLSSFRIQYYINQIDDFFNVKKIYNVDSSIDFYQILINLDIDKINGDIISNPEIYKKFQEIMYKFKLNKIPNSLVNYLNNNMILDFSLDIISTFINYFTSIMKDIEKQKGVRLNLATFIKNASVYDSASIIYKLILGEEDFKLIKSNPPENAATKKTKNDERLKESVDVMLDCFKRQEITIPAFNEVITLNDNANIRCVVGNFTNPCNLTHGERTGACMRIGGFAETLFNFCYQNKNGFHIRFEDPNTGQYISRVSGFRNGNTVFLNELRFSCHKDYTNDNVLDAMKIVGDKLIEYSKSSSCPIENVVLHNDYVTKNLKTVDLRVDNIKSGLPYFYSDVNSRAIVVSSVNKDGFVPLQLNQPNVPSYQVARELPRQYIGIEDFYKNSSRINAIRQVIDLGSKDFITKFSLDNGFIFGIVGDDFYCYLDNDYNIIEECIGIDPRGYQELEIAKRELEKYKENLNQNTNKIN